MCLVRKEGFKVLSMGREVGTNTKFETYMTLVSLQTSKLGCNLSNELLAGMTHSLTELKRFP